MVSICVFCGSKPGLDPVFTQTAIEVGQILTAQKVDLVYGGGTWGIMGTVARSVVENGGSVVGIIPRALIEREGGGEAIGEVIVVEDMHTRKALMSKRADAYLALPGGFGTLEELLEVITWSQLGIHQKPIIVLNVKGFFAGLQLWIEQSVKEGFITPGNRAIVQFIETAAELPEALNNYRKSEDALNLKWNLP